MPTEAWKAAKFAQHTRSTYSKCLRRFLRWLERIDAACAEVGRDPATLGRLLFVGMRISGVTASPEAFRDAVGRFAELGVTDIVVPWPRRAAPFAGDLGTLEVIAAEARVRGGRVEGQAKSP